MECGNEMASRCSSRRRTATIKIKGNNNRIITSLNGKKGQKKGVYMSKKSGSLGFLDNEELPTQYVHHLLKRYILVIQLFYTHTFILPVVPDCLRLVQLQRTEIHEFHKK